MSKMIMSTVVSFTVVSLASASAFADLKDCSHLMGSYSCERQVDLELKQTSMTGLQVQIGNQSVEVVVDGTSHKSPAGTSTYVAFCTKEGEITLIDTVRDIKQMYKISPTSTGLNYTVQKGQEFTLACHKN